MPEVKTELSFAVTALLARSIKKLRKPQKIKKLSYLALVLRKNNLFVLML